MAETVSGHQLGAISTPANGAALVASVVRGNFQSTRTAYNAHDADPAIHLQSSVAGSKPAAGTAGRKWLETDTLKVFYDNGSTWDEIAYAPTASPTFTGTAAFANLTTSGTIVATGTITGTLATAAQPNITSLGTLTAATIAGNLTFSGASRKLVPGTTSLTISNVGDTVAAVDIRDTLILIGTSGVPLDFRVNSGALAASATVGFFKCSTTSGAPSGAVADGTLAVDTSNHTLCYRSGGAWRTLTGA